MPFFKKKVDGYVKDEYKTGVEVNYYESEFITINPKTTIIRLSFLTNANHNRPLTEVPDNSNYYWMYNVSLDELELYGY